MGEQYEEDPSFALQVTLLLHNTEDINNPSNTDIDFDDDTELSAQILVHLHFGKFQTRPQAFMLHGNTFMTNESDESGENDGYWITSPFDDETLTDNDAEGETDPEGEDWSVNGEELNNGGDVDSEIDDKGLQSQSN
ncbi:hypothetical protein BS47DRAFT_1387877 [Hydnum rufescens UP504]|uniref:Uncharacterized protein n=1 Tax=Hydnum rufescens UP504 TaxID=1448309 RepID=A0A9P6E1V7_9AGAM|nr:hypothetical protein BS47DRAFT_1387877 [Hydnum rufescens UP504]